MKYKVTFDNGQVSVFDTETQFDEFKAQYTKAVSIDIIGGKPAPAIKVPAAVAPITKAAKKK